MPRRRTIIFRPGPFEVFSIAMMLVTIAFGILAPVMQMVRNWLG